MVVGNLVVRADPTFGGGALNVSGERIFFYTASFMLMRLSVMKVSA